MTQSKSDTKARQGCQSPAGASGDTQHLLTKSTIMVINVQDASSRTQHTI